MMDVSLLIGDQDRAAGDGASFERRNPVTGEVATRAAAATVEDAKAAADAAAAAFPAWSALGPSERRDLLLDAADRLQAEADEFVRVAAAETGATAGWIGSNVQLAAGMLREATAMTPRSPARSSPPTSPAASP